MTGIKVSNNRIDKHFNELSLIGNLPYGGFTRASWSVEESIAFEYIKGRAEKAGLITTYDGIGNLLVMLPGETEEMVMTGSHLDTVPEGGNFDGAVGIVAGIESLVSIKESGLPLKKGLGLVVWRGEESGTFNQAYKGSKGAFGESFGFDILQKEYKGQTLEDAIKSEGFDPSFFREQKPTLTQEYVDMIAALLEQHIEQGNLLETKGLDIGIVNAVRNPSRASIELAGDNYCGDICTAKILVQLDRLAQSKDNDLVQTIGVINTEKAPKGPIKTNAMTKVSGYCEVRMDTSHEYVKRIIDDVAERLKVEITPNPNCGDPFYEIRGNFDHSGATPMGPEFRKDANLAAAYIISDAYDAGQITTAQINYPKGTNPHFIVDIRSTEKVFKDEYTQNAMEIIKNVAGFFGFQRNILSQSSEDPVEKLDEQIIELTKQECDKLGYSYEVMPSGAGHDFAVVSKQKHSNGLFIPTGAQFIQCIEGKSHCVEEAIRQEDAHKGAHLHANLLYQLSAI
ncbi:MAG: M20/M25/M40 family metallo-hydrolase [bacterium]|nr:M20/M25/M40 family metallo-hydrolase [bacterium]